MIKYLLTALAALMFSTHLFADSTFVSGNIVGETWTPSGSPYIVDGDILIAELLIEPEVEICFSGNYVFEVIGILTAIGTNQDSIYFKRSLTNTVGWQGIYFNLSAPGSELAYCRIEGSINRGIRIENSTTHVFPDIQNCTVRNNSDSQGGSVGRGGGVYVNGEAVLKNCLISNNVVSRSGDNISSRGGGIYVEGTLTLINTVVKRNTVNTIVSHILDNISSYGGGVYVIGESRLYNCIVDSNSAIASDTHGGGTITARGGGLYLNGLFVLSNSIISYNIARANPAFQTSWSDQGGGLYGIDSDSSSIINSTIFYNEDEGIRSAGDTLSIVNSIVFSTIPSTNQIIGPVRVNYCDVEGDYPGIGNINFNPILISDADYYLRIAHVSLCVDAGDPSLIHDDVCFPPSWEFDRNDIGAHGGPGACSWNTIVGINNKTINSLSQYSLDQNYPNPFNPATHISFTLFKASDVKLKVYNTLGQEVATLLDERRLAGTHLVDFDGSNLSSGVYFYKIQAGSFQRVKKMLLMK